MDSSKPDKIRIQYLRDSEAFFVIHQQIKDFIEKFDHIRLQGKRIRTSSMTIVGKSGMGKSALALAYIHLKGNDPTFHADFVERPVVIVRMPSTSSPSAFFERILHVYNEPRPEYGTIAQKQYRVYRVLEAAKTQLLFIDEIHNLLDSGGDRTRRYILSILKDVANECKIPFVLMGTDNAANILHFNEEVSRRFPVVELKPFAEITEDFRKFLAGFEKNLPLKKSSGLDSNDEVVKEIVKYSKGVVADISALLRASAIAAIQSRTEKIDLTEIDAGKAMLINRVALE